MQTYLTRVKPHLVPACGLILLTLAVYGQALGFDFQTNWDDYQYVTHNPDILGFSAKNLIRVFSSVYVGNYAPVHLLSYMLDYQLAGMDPAWFHGVNILFHCANGLLFYLLVYRLTKKPFWAFAAAGFFLLHPAQVESVAWVSQRKNLLAMFFSLCSFHSYVSYRQRTGERRSRAYILSAVFLILALFAKSIAVIIPFAFLLYDFFVEIPGRRKGCYADKIPFFIAVAVASVITLYTQSVQMGGGSIDFFEGSITAKILTMLPVLTSYLQILVWPSPSSLNSIYIFHIKTGIDGEAVFALLVVVALCSVGAYLARREQRLFFGFALFFLGLVPVSQIVPLATLMNDRYLYFPMLGAAWIVGGLLSRLKDTFPQKRINPALILVTGLLIPLAILSYQRSKVWQNSITLWSDVVKKLPDLRDPRGALAQAYLDAGREKDALTAYEELFVLKRDFTEPLAERKALLQAAALYIDSRSLGKALPLLTTLTTKFPEYPPGFLNLGYYHYLNHHLPEAEKAYRKALHLEPASTQALISLGNICLETGRVAEARELYRTCYENGGNSPDLQFNLACVEALEKNYEAALQYLAEALKLGYRNLEAINGNPELAPLRRLASFNELITVYFGRP
jgi:tetratricopeptide (TPR) repeat protein